MKQKTKKVFITIASLLTLPTILSLVASKCKPDKPELNINEIANNVKVDVKDKASKHVSEVKKEDIAFSNYDSSKYEINDVKFTTTNDNKLNVLFKLKEKKTSNISNFVLKQVSEFKKNRPITPNDVEIQKSNNLIRKNQKIKYLSIGDSISAGFTGKLDKDYPGEFENGKVSGMSFAAYLAYYLNKLDSGNRLEKFNNFATSNSTIWEWLDLLDVNYLPTDSAFSKKDSVYDSTFLRFTNKEELKTNLIKEIKYANLITMTLGANDFFRMFFAALNQSGLKFQLESILKGEKLDYAAFANFFFSFLNKAKAEIQHRLEALLAKIKELNPNANINVLNYPAPFLRLATSLMDFLPDLGKAFINVKYLMEQLSDPIKTAAKNIGGNINFMDMLDDEFWDKNQKDLTKILFDLHPTPFGYKKLAQDVLVKLISDRLNKSTLQNRLGWTEGFVNKNLNSHKWQIETNDDLEKIYKTFIGWGKNDSYRKLLEEDELYKEIKPKLDSNNLSNRLQGFPDEQMEEIFLALFTKIFSLDILKDLDPDLNIPKFFLSENKAAIKSLIKWFKKSNYLKKNLDKAQKRAENTTPDINGHIKKEELVQILKETLLNPEELLELLKELLKSDFNKEFKEKLIDAVEKFIANMQKNKDKNLLKLAIQKIVKSTYHSVKQYIESEKDYETLLTKIITSDKMPTFFGRSLKSLLSSANDSSLDSIKTFNGLIKLFFKGQSENGKIAQAFDEMFQDVLQDPDVNPILVRIIANYFEKNYPQILQGDKKIESKELKDLIGAFVNSGILLNKEFGFTKLLTNSLLNEFKTNGFEFNFGNLINSLQGKFREYFAKNYEKLIITTLRIFAQNNEFQDPEIQTTIKKLILNSYKYFAKEHKFKEKLVSFLKQKLPAAGLADEDFTNLFDVIVNDENIDLFSEYMISLILDNKLDWTKITNLKQLAEEIISNQKLSPSKFVKDFLNKLKDDNKVINVVYKLGNSFGIFENISENDSKKIVKSLLGSIIKADDELNIGNKFIKFFVEKLSEWKPENNLDISKSLLEFVNYLKQEFNNEEALVKAIKMILKEIDLDESVLTKLFENIYKLIKDRLNLTNYIWNLVGSKLPNVNEAEFKKVINAILDNAEIKAVLKNSIVKTFIFIKNENLDNVKTFKQFGELLLKNDGPLYKELLSKKFEVFKSLLKTNEIKNSKDLFKNLINAAYSLVKNQLEPKKIVTDLLKNNLSFILDDPKIEKIANEILSDDLLNIIFDKFYDVLFNNLDVLDTTNSFTGYLKKIFEKPNNKASQLLEGLLTSIFNKPNTKSLLLELFNVLKLTKDFSDTEKNNLINFILKMVGALDEKLKLTENIVLKLTETIDANEFEKFNSELFDELFSKIKAQFSSQKEQIQLFAWMLKDNTFTQSKDLIKKLVVNAYSFITDKFMPTLEEFYSQIPDTVKEFIKENEFKELLKVIVSSTYTKDFIDKVIDILFTKTIDFNSIETYFSFIKKVLLETKAELKPEIIKFANGILGDAIVQKGLISIIKNVAKNLGNIDLKDSHEIFFKKLLANAFTIFDSIGLYDTFLNAIINNLDDPNKIIDTVKETVLKLPFTDPKWLISILNQQTIKESKEDVIKLIEDIFDQFISDEEKIKKLLDKLNLVSLINNDPSTQETTKQLLVSILKNSKTKELLKQIITTIFDNSDTLKDANRWVDVIKKLASSDKIETLKTSVKNFAKGIIENDDLLAKQAEIILTKMWKSNSTLYKSEVLDKNKNVVAKFVDSLLKAVIKENTIFDTVLKNIFDELKNIPTNTDDQVKEIMNTILKGAVKFVAMDGKDDTIDISKFIGLGTRIKTIFSEINPKSFVNFINLMFDMNKFNLDGGLYSILFSQMLKEEVQKNDNLVKIMQNDAKTKAISYSIMSIRSKRTRRSAITYEKTKDFNIKFDFKFEIGSFIKLLGNISPLIESIFLPAAKEYFNEITKQKYTDKKAVKKLQSYKALQRIYASILMLAYPNTYNQKLPGIFIDTNLFWGDLNTTVEGYLSSGLDKAFDTALTSEMQSKIDSVYDYADDKHVIGIRKLGKNYKRIDSMFSGGRKLSYKNYSSYDDDSILSYVWNYNRQNKHYENASNIVLLAKVLQFGYLYKDMDKDL